MKTHYGPIRHSQMGRTIERAHVVNLQAKFPGSTRNFSELQQNIPLNR